MIVPTSWFIQILNMSLAASWAALLVMLARIPLRRAPKAVSYALWGVVLFRLVCPVSFTSAISLMPRPQAIPQDIVYAMEPAIQSGFPPLDMAVNQSLPPAIPYASANPLQIYLGLGADLWMLVAVLFLAYCLVSYLRFCHKLADAVRTEGNIYESDRIQTAFVLGFFRPRIYLPLGLSEEERRYILCHERTHIRRMDHWVKLAALLVLAAHWFNPVLWAAYLLMCRDMEMSCDERVMKELGPDIRKGYSASLLALSVRQNGLITPLAFGENDVKTRIRNVLRYKKPAFWVILAALVLAAALAFCLAANPGGTVPLSKQEELPYHDSVWAQSILVTMPGKEKTALLDNPRKVEELCELVRELKVTRQPISQSRSEERPWDFSLEFRRPLEVSVGGFTLYFTEGSVWGDDWTKPSLTYGVSDTEISRLLQKLEELLPTEVPDEEAVSGEYYVGFIEARDRFVYRKIVSMNPQTGTRMASLLLSGTEVPLNPQEKAPPVADFLRVEMGNAGAAYYVYEEEGRFYMERLTDYRLEITGDTYGQIRNIYLGTASEEIRQPALTFPTAETTMEGIARNGIEGYYSAFMAEDIPVELRLTSFAVRDITPMAGDLEEFAVSFLWDYDTPAAAYWVSANGNSLPREDGSWSWTDSYSEFRFRKTGEGEYQIVDMGTGGVAQGLAPIPG